LDAADLLDSEEAAQAAYPEAVLLFSEAEFEFIRNCHDYAWGPYMTCMCSPAPPGDQKECWWMNDPSANWSDDSMWDAAVSVYRAEDGTMEYLFNTSDLDWLPWAYYDETGYMIPLPTCDLSTLNDQPAHSALLVDWVNPMESISYYGGIFESKWGFLGLFQHRWGLGYCPDSYCQANTLRVFAPDQGWGYAPPYLIYADPFGPSE
jgi:hypothetical protein